MCGQVWTYVDITSGSKVSYWAAVRPTHHTHTHTHTHTTAKNELPTGGVGRAVGTNVYAISVGVA